MQVHKMIGAAALSASLLLSAFMPGSSALADTPANLVQNPGFEADWSPDPWEVAGDASAVSVSDEGSGNAHTGSKYLKYYKGTGFSFSVTQTVYGVPDGIYTLTAAVQGNAGASLSQIFAKDYGDIELTRNFANTGWGRWSEPAIANFKVTGGKVTIGMRIQSPGELWGVLDDVALVKVGDISAEAPVIAAITPVQVTSIVRDSPPLPTVVTAVYSDKTAKSLPVVWEPVDPATLQQPGSFEVRGSVQGTDIPATASITVTYKSMDVNNDQAVNVGDLAVAVYYAGFRSDNAGWAQAKASDVNNDGTVDAADIQLIARKIRNP